jgi:capsular polysaccharide biosynthesis protein
MIAPTASYSFIAALPFGIIGIIGFIFIVILIGRNYLDEKEDEKERVKKELGL